MPSTTDFISQSIAGLETIQLTASVALDPATGSGTTYLYEVGSATTINLTASASTVGGVATYVASNHGAGAKLLVNDSAAGQWDVSQVGAPTSEAIARYSVRGVAANISLVNGPNILPIGSLVNSDLVSSGMSIASEHDPLGWRTANQITVSKTGRYRVDVQVVHTAANLSGTDAQATSGSSRSGIRINGTSIEWTGIDDTAGLADQTSGFIVRQFAAGDEIDVVVNATSTEANEDFYVSFAMEELPSTETILAGHVVPTELSRAQFSLSTVQTANLSDTHHVNWNTTDLMEGTKIVLDTTTAYTNAANVNSAGRFTLQPGKYSIKSSVNGNVAQSNGFVSISVWDVNAGVPVGSADMGTTANQGVTGASTSAQIKVVGSPRRYEIRIVFASGITQLRGNDNAQLSRSTVEINELPDSTVVNPDTVPVTAMNKFEARKNATQNIPTGANTDVAFGELTSSVGSGYNPATGVFTAPSAGWYSFDSAARMDYEFAAVGGEMFIAILVNGAEKARGGFAFVGTNASPGSYYYGSVSASLPLAAGDQVKVQCRQNSGVSLTLNGAGPINYFTGVQTSTHSVIRPEDTVVNDQAASGFVDIGATRMQWGSTGASATTGTVTLPASFADSNYTVTSSTTGAADMLAVGSRATSSFTWTNYNHDGATQAGVALWFAIGLRP